MYYTRKFRNFRALHKCFPWEWVNEWVSECVREEGKYEYHVSHFNTAFHTYTQTHTHELTCRARNSPGARPVSGSVMPRQVLSPYNVYIVLRPYNIYMREVCNPQIIHLSIRERYTRASVARLHTNSHPRTSNLARLLYSVFSYLFTVGHWLVRLFFIFSFFIFFGQRFKTPVHCTLHSRTAIGRCQIINIYIYMCIYINVSLSLSLSLSLCLCVCVCMYICLHVHICMCVCVCVCVCVVDKELITRETPDPKT
jgi:hypothetical protein